MLFSTSASQLCVLYAISPLHAGAGQSTGAVDLPIQRERHTGWPMVQASGVKGAFRDWFTRYYTYNESALPDMKASKDQAEELARRVFGREETAEGPDGHAGAISITDARVLAFPVRCSAAPFVWVTAPYVLTRLARDVRLCPNANGISPDSFLTLPPIPEHCVVVSGDFADNKGIVLEDLALNPVKSGDNVEILKDAFRVLAPQATRLLLITDSDFTYLVRNATEIQPQICINPETGTTKTGSLRYQELLPADSILYSLVFFTTERTDEKPQPVDIIQELTVTAISTHVQIGGDMTLGRGLMEIRWLPGKA